MILIWIILNIWMVLIKLYNWSILTWNNTFIHEFILHRKLHDNSPIWCSDTAVLLGRTGINGCILKTFASDNGKSNWNSMVCSDLSQKPRTDVSGINKIHGKIYFGVFPEWLSLNSLKSVKVSKSKSCMVTRDTPWLITDVFPEVVAKI